MLCSPVSNLKLTCRSNEADRRLYVISGQHLVKAVVRTKEDRESEGFPLEHWMWYVDADILRYETPIDRKYFAALNASTRLMRTSTVTKCLRVMRSLETDVLDQTELIMKAIQQCGMNSPDSSPVCPRFRVFAKCA